jgi:hypothetical protein
MKKPEYETLAEERELMNKEFQIILKSQLVKNDQVKEDKNE